MHWSDRQWFAVAVGLYALSTGYGLWLRRQGFRRDDWINYAVLLAGGMVHTAAMLLRGFALGRCPTTNLYEATVFVSWGIVAAYALVGLWPRFRFLGAFVAPWLVGLGLLALRPSWDTPRPWSEVVASLGTLHRSFILLAFGSFGLAAGAGLMLLLQDYDLKHAVVRALRARLPAMDRLELSLRWALGIGLGLLTVGLGLGMVYLNQRRGRYLSTDPAVVYAWGVWLWYASVLVGHWRFAQRGRRLAWGAVASFALVAGTFWGFYSLSPLHKPPQVQHSARPLAWRRTEAARQPAKPNREAIPARALAGVLDRSEGRGVGLGSGR